MSSSKRVHNLEMAAHAEIVELDRQVDEVRAARHCCREARIPPGLGFCLVS